MQAAETERPRRAGQRRNPDLHRLAAVGVTVPSPEATAAFLHEMLEFEVVEGQGQVLHLTAAGDYGIASPRRMLSLRPGSELVVTDVTFEVTSPDGLQRQGERLASRGVRTERVAEDDEGGEGLSFQDPAGISVFLRLRGAPLDRSLPPSALRPRRLGHVNLKVPNAAGEARFYQEALGLPLSEQVGDLLYFLRVSSDHHNLGFRGGAPRPNVHHIAFEIHGWETFRVICDHIAARGHVVEYGPGRHGPGNNLFVYVVEPSSGLRLELYADMAHIHDDESYVPPKWETLDRVRTANRWGPQPPTSFLE